MCANPHSVYYWGKYMKQKPGPKQKQWDLEQIKNKTVQEGDCHIWQGAKHPQGYGMMRFDSKMRTVHSVIIQLKYGRFPGKSSKEKITRTCGNNECVNPDHLIIKNMHDVMVEAKHVGTGCKFTKEDIQTIRRECEEKPYYGKQKELAERYNASSHHINSIIKRRIYKWVD